jgi:hypothetical protein
MLLQQGRTLLASSCQLRCIAAAYISRYLCLALFFSCKQQQRKQRAAVQTGQLKAAATQNVRSVARQIGFLVNPFHV